MNTARKPGRCLGLVGGLGPGATVHYYRELDMAAGGAEFTAIVAATAHICARELAALSRLPSINMLTEVRQAVDAEGLRRVGLLGTRFTIESRMFGCLDGIETIMPDADRVGKVHELYKEFVDGHGSDQKANELRKIAQEFVSSDGAQSALIAGTDLSNVFSDSNAGFPMIDCARVHIDAISGDCSTRASHPSAASARRPSILPLHV